MDIETVKEYLRIDEDADDNVIKLMMRVAKQFIKDGVGFYDEENVKMNMLFLYVMQDLYENRILSVKEAEKQRFSGVVTSLVLQLQVEALVMEDEADG